MPVDLPNPKFFKPQRPTAINRHFLFGTKFFKVHQFRDPKWPPTSITEQYFHMIKCLKKNLQFNKLRISSESHKVLETLNGLKLELHNGRERLKSAHLGNLTGIRRILITRKDLQRKYRGMSLDAIMENCDQETFLKRKENDRLKLQLKQASERLKEVLLEESKLVDRVQYANAFALQTELDANMLRKDIKNSATRITAYKIITRAYHNIKTLMERDDIYFESILDALEKDMAEQKNFIQQIIVLGIPAKNKYRQLSDEFSNMEYNARLDLKETSDFLGDIRKQLLILQKDTKAVVRTYHPPKVHEYVRSTASMNLLQRRIEKLESQINGIRLVTMSHDAETVEETLAQLVNNLNYFEMKNANDDMHNEVLTKKFDLGTAKKSMLTHNYGHPEAERLQTIEDYKLQINYQKKLQDQYQDDIVTSGNMLQMLTFSLWNICDVLRHVAKKADMARKEYPNDELKLPLLRFDFMNLLSVPPVDYDRSAKQLLALAKLKIGVLVKNQVIKTKYTDDELADIEKKYHDTYLYSIQDDESRYGLVDVDYKGSGDALFATVFNDVNVLSRSNIKDMSAKIVEKNAKKDTDFD